MAEKTVEKVAEYTVISKITVGDLDFVLGENTKLYKKYATWRSRAGEGDYQHGNYLEDKVDAVRDMCKRVLKYTDLLKDQERANHAKDKYDEGR